MLTVATGGDRLLKNSALAGADFKIDLVFSTGSIDGSPLRVGFSKKSGSQLFVRTPAVL